MRKEITLITLLAIGIGASSAWAKGPRKGQHEGSFKGGIAVHALLKNPDIAEQVGVTDEELVAMKSIVQTGKKEMIPLEADRELARTELEELLEQPSPDQAMVVAAVEKLGGLQTEAHKTRVLNQLKIKELLGQEKIDAIKALAKEQRKDRREDRSGDRDKRFRGGFSGE